MNEKTLREYLLKETEIVQDIISRMANNQFYIEGWSITLVVASLLFKGTFYHHLVAFIPLVIFWIYDAYFLWLEKLYREHYDWLIRNRVNNDELLLDMDKGRLEKNYGKQIPSKLWTMVNKKLIVFYGVLSFVVLCAILVEYSHRVS